MQVSRLRRLRGAPGSPLRARLRTELPLALVVAAVSFYLLIRWYVGDGGALVLGADQVAVERDHMRGTERVLTEPGTHLFVPLLQEVHRFSRRPFEYRLEGNDPVGPGRGPRLLIRARDGASYSMDRVVVQAALDPAATPLVLEDSGTGERAQRLVDAFARSSLREAFGVFDTEQILAPEARASAAEEARTKLAERLSRHGMRLLELDISAPIFAPQVVETIARRQVAEEDTTRLSAKGAKLREGSPEQQAEYVRRQQLEENKLRSLMTKNLAKAGLAAKRDLDTARGKAAARLQQGELKRAADQGMAERLTQEHGLEAAALAERVARLEEWGPLAVRAALIEKLGGIRFDLEPRAGEAKGGSAGGL